MKNVVVVAPHPDDETLGCGATLLKHVKRGDLTHWVIVTCMTPKVGYSTEACLNRRMEIEKVSEQYGFKSVVNLEFPTTRLDQYSISSIIQRLHETFLNLKPEILYAPFGGDVHTDHQIVFQAVQSSTKSFRHPYIKRILCYEVLSETEFCLGESKMNFRPNVFVDITDTLDHKIEILQTYRRELSTFPFPRSIEAVRSLAHLRGTTAGVQAAEAFMLLREIL